MATVTAKSRRFWNAQPYAPGMGWRAWALHHAWVLPIVMVAAWLRFAGTSSHFLYGDEAEYAIVARYLSRDPLYLAYPAIEGLGATPFVSQPPLLLYLEALSIRILGPTDFAALLPSLVLGTATVVALYALGHRLGGRFLGLSAAAVLAVLPFDIQITRKAMLDAGYTFFLVLAAYFLVAWVQERRRRYAVGTGVAVACAALSKLPGMLAGPAVLLVFLYVLAVALARRDAKQAKELAIQAGLGAAPIAVAAALYVALLWYLSALQNLWVKLLWQLGRVDVAHAQVQEVGAVARPPSFYFTDPQFSFGALFGGTLLLLALLGALVAVGRFARRPVGEAAHLAPLVLGAVLLGFFLYSQRKEGFYLLPFAPLVALYVGYLADGARRALAAGGRRVPSFAPHAALAATAVAVLLVALPAYAAAQTSLNKYAAGNDQEKYFGSGTREAAAWVHARDPNAAMYGTVLGRFSLYWYTEQTTYHWYVDHTYLDQQIQSGKLKYVVYDEYLGQSFDTAYMQEIIQRYHGEVVANFRQGWGDVKVVELHP
jgi:4-amino-4-deoxy-L-arabinose transferase-like glycosyltransferase